MVRRRPFLLEAAKTIYISVIKTVSGLSQVNRLLRPMQTQPHFTFPLLVNPLIAYFIFPYRLFSTSYDSSGKRHEYDFLLSLLSLAQPFYNSRKHVWTVVIKFDSMPSGCFRGKKRSSGREEAPSCKKMFSSLLTTWQFSQRSTCSVWMHCHLYRYM